MPLQVACWVLQVAFWVRSMPSEANKYWLYSRECTLQALRAGTNERRSQLLDLARTWSEAAIREELEAKGSIPLPERRGDGLRG